MDYDGASSSMAPGTTLFQPHMVSLPSTPQQFSQVSPPAPSSVPPTQPGNASVVNFLDEPAFNATHDPLPKENPNVVTEQQHNPSELLRQLWQKWYPGREVGQISWSGMENVAQLFAVFGIDPKDRVNSHVVSERFKQLSLEAATCLNRLETSGEIRAINASSAMRMIFKKLEAGKQLLLGLCMLCSADTMQPSDLPRDDYGLWKFMPPASEMGGEEPNAGQRLRMFALTDIMRLGYRRYRSSLMRRLYTSDSLPTCAWVPDITVEDYVRSLTRRQLTNPEVWNWITVGAGWSPAKNLVEYLLHSDDPEVPWLEPDRHVFSFSNGVYLAKDEIFIPYDRLHKFYSSESYPVACNHFDMVFNSAHLTIPDPTNIPTPTFEDMFNSQKLSPEVKRWTYALMGRLLYDVGEMDDWQVFLFIKGMAGTGKSCLLNHIKRIYDPQDTGVISNMVEKQFGFSQVANKFVGIADDIRGTFQLDQSDFQNACSGNAVSCAVKFKDPLIIERWKTPLVLSGNEPPGYRDNSGSFGRRMAVVLFMFIVSNPDTFMQQKLYSEMASFIAKCNRQYRNMLRRFGNKGIWNILPQEFKIQRAELTATSNALVGFLSSSNLCRGEGMYMPLDSLRDSVMQYAQKTNLEKPHWGPDFFRGPLVQEKLTIGESPEKRYYPRFQDKRRVFGLFVYGCDLAINCEDDVSTSRGAVAAGLRGDRTGEVGGAAGAVGAGLAAGGGTTGGGTSARTARRWPAGEGPGLGLPDAGATKMAKNELQQQTTIYINDMPPPINVTTTVDNGSDVFEMTAIEPQQKSTRKRPRNGGGF